MSVFNTISNKILDLFFPRTCVGCGSDGQLLCQSCGQQLQPLSQRLEIEGIKLTLVAADYQQPILQQVIKQFKYHNLDQLAEPLATLLAQVLKLESTLPSFCLAPIPLHPKRLRQRGYNQSELLAKELSKVFHWQCLNGLTRIIDTKHQAGLSRDERLKNISQAFAYTGPSLIGRHLLLIDDVVTTGTTLQAAATALQTAKPSAIWALAVARNQEGDN